MIFNINGTLFDQKKKMFTYTKQAKFSEKLTFLTPRYAYVHIMNNPK